MKKAIQFLLLMLLMTMNIFAGPKDYVLVNGGSFVMGNNNEGDAEYPEHKVELNSFYMSKYEVTQKEYKAVMSVNPSLFKGDNKPVETVSWYDAVVYANKLSEKEGLKPYYIIKNIKKDKYNSINSAVVTIAGGTGYRLPTEAEWEYAAMGGEQYNGYQYSGSNNVDEVAWTKENSGWGTQIVGGKKANELGIYDMSGSVWEWCWDWYGLYDFEKQTNPTGPSSSEYRIIRGASWLTDSSSATVTSRNYNFPYFYGESLGIRLVRSF